MTKAVASHFLIAAAQNIISPLTFLVHITEDCRARGNIYAQVAGTDCHKFTQATKYLPPQVHSCPDGLQFDLHTCVCNYPKDTVCYV